MASYITFELYLDHGHGPATFEPVTCPREQLVPIVRRMIEERGLRAIEVREMGAPLFTVAGETAD